MGEDAAFEEGVEPVFDELRQVGAGCRLGLLKEGGGVLLQLAVLRGLLGAVALAVEPGAIRCPDRPTGLPADGLHAWLPSC